MDKSEILSLLKGNFAGRKLILLSNREPYVHRAIPRGFVCEKQAGGVAIALDPVMQMVGGTWIAWGSGNLDKRFVDEKDKVKVPPQDPKYVLRRVWLTEEEVENYYLGFSNRSLWPLAHNLCNQVVFRKKFWESYKKVNDYFVQVALEEIKNEKVLIWVNDYQLSLVPQKLRSEAEDSLIIFFWHIPWPSYDVFCILPNRKEFLEGLLGSDLLGFHTQNFCRNFLTCVEQELEAKVDLEKSTVIYKDHVTKVQAFPISIDFEHFSSLAQSKETHAMLTKLRKGFHLDDTILGLSVDRLDYTKGIPEKLKALDLFLERYPQYQSKFTFVQIAAPSRTKIKAYRELREEVVRLVNQINEKYQMQGWRPILLINRQVDHKTLSIYYRLADLAIISSVRDGMNLVAKEFIASQIDEKGILCLSEFAGAFEEMEYSIPINPYYTDGFAEAMKKALEMPLEEKRDRIRKMRQYLKEHDIYNWTYKIFQALKEMIPSKVEADADVFVTSE
jgi:alpha,alpha-trehalose-phosphate synthase [UDP-forming]